MILRKIISGGQTGADRAGLTAAKEFGLETGGWMPKGFRALDGFHPHFRQLYGMREHVSPSYPDRTYANAGEANGTVRFAVDFTTSGERCTLNAIRCAKSIYFDVNVLGDKTPQDLANWIQINEIEVLNVAGNSEKTATKIGEFVHAFLVETFKILAKNDDASGTAGGTIDDNCNSLSDDNKLTRAAD